ncbi:MAG TPA: hypothetical protein VKN35_06825, partial [Xanthomonadales bacterium]|nr:hypothetical protein [Xanthomonadales bacterium]
YADWSTPASVSVLRGKAFDEVDAKLLDQVYAAETSDYVFNLRFTDTVIVDVWGDGSERYKVGFVNCSLGTETDNCATTSPAADNVIRMTAAPL